MKLIILTAFLLFLGACSTPRRLVIQDNPEFSTHVLSAVDEFEDQLGCKVWKKVVVGGKSEDWEGFPPFGTITIMHNPSRVPDGLIGQADITHVGKRTRIYLQQIHPSHFTVIHELLHRMLGRDHDTTGIMAKREGGTLADALADSPELTKARLQDLCLDS